MEEEEFDLLRPLLFEYLEGAGISVMSNLESTVDSVITSPRVLL